MTKRELQKQSTKNKIFKNAMLLFTKNGFDNVTIDQICEKSNIAKGTFYVHYKTKSDILVEKYSMLDNSYKEKFEEICKLNISSPEKLKMYLNEIFIIIKEKFGVDMVQTLYSHHLKKNDFNILLNEERLFYQTIHFLCEDLISEYNLGDTLESKFLTNMILSSIRGNCYDWAISDGSIDLVNVGTLRMSFIIDNLVNSYKNI